MNLDSIEFRSAAHKAIRFTYVVVLIALAVFARLTYEELQRQRHAPVILPFYAFNIVDNPEKASVIRALGTWYTADGRIPTDNLQTTTIECTKARRQCAESTAVVSVREKGFLDSTSSIFEVERWTDEQIVTKPEIGRCTTRVISLDLANRQVRSVITANPDAENCRERPGTFKLDSGSKARAEALEKAK